MKQKKGMRQKEIKQMKWKNDKKRRENLKRRNGKRNKGATYTATPISLNDGTALRTSSHSDTALLLPLLEGLFLCVFAFYLFVGKLLGLIAHHTRVLPLSTLEAHLFKC